MLVQINHCPTASVWFKLAALQRSGELCDFTIVVSGAQIKAHKCVLAAASEYFRTLFHFNKSSQSISEKSETDLSNLECDATEVEKVIHSFYTSRIDLDLDCLEQILLLADYFMCDGLCRCVVSYMERTLTFPISMVYFRLTLQHGLNSAILLDKSKWMLLSRFHDYFIHQPKLCELSVDVVNALISVDIFVYCNPLQIMQFILRIVGNTVERLQNSDKNDSLSTEEMPESVRNLLMHLPVILLHTQPCFFRKWKPHLQQYMKEWKANYVKDGRGFGILQDDVAIFERKFHMYNPPREQMCFRQEDCDVCSYRSEAIKCILFNIEQKNHLSAVCSNPDCKYKMDPFVKRIKAVVMEDCCFTKESDYGIEDVYHEDFCACTPKVVREYLEERLKLNSEHRAVYDRSWLASRGITEEKMLQSEIFKPVTKSRNRFKSVTKSQTRFKPVTKSQTCTGDGAGNSDIQEKNSSPNTSGIPVGVQAERTSNILIVLAPTAEMASQAMATDDEAARPLLKAPELQISYYDIQMNTWRAGNKMKFPVPGPMEEGQCWRMTFLNKCLYLFSLVKRLGLEYNTVKAEWTKLSCEELFMDHAGDSQVRSIVPAAVGNKLIVLSMSRCSTEEGTYLTQQKFFEMDSSTKKFSSEVSVHDERFAMPTNQWTVCGNSLISVKTSSLVAGHISRIEHFHIYNTDTKQVETHHAECAVENGMKVLVRDRMIYLVDKEGWCRSYNLDKSCWAKLKRYPAVDSKHHASNADSHYPAYTKVCCQAGPSHWEVSSREYSTAARMQEMMVLNDGELQLVSHPPPPFQYMTAMCTGKMAREQLDSLAQPVFDYEESSMTRFF